MSGLARDVFGVGCVLAWAAVALSAWSHADSTSLYPDPAHAGGPCAHAQCSRPALVEPGARPIIPMSRK